MKTALGAVGFVVVFNAMALAVLLQLPPASGVAWGITIGAGFLWWHLRPGQAGRARRERVRIRPPTRPAGWVLLAVASTLLLAFGLSGLIGHAAPSAGADAPPLYQAILDYQTPLDGWVAIVVMTALVLPMVEEFCFRGHLQHTLEKRYGPAPAIAASSVLFMLAHVGGPHWSILLIPLTLGVALGVIVYLSGSIWVAVGVHGLWNLAMATAEKVPEPATSPIVEPGVLLRLGLLLLALGAAGWAVILTRSAAAPRTSP